MHLWRANRSTTDGAWERISIPEAGLALVAGDGTEFREATLSDRQRDRQRALAVFAPVTMDRSSGPGHLQLVLLCAPGASVFVSGQRPFSVAPLRDRDEISVSDQRLVFAAADEESVVAFKHSGKETHCQRCSRVLDDRDQVVWCPNCGSPHHEGLLVESDPPTSLLCWSDVQRCAGCLEDRASMVWDPTEVLS